VKRRSRAAAGFTALDALITLSLIAVLFGVVVPRYQRVAQEARETAIQAELANIRTSIRLFRMIQGMNPHDLRELMEREVLLPARVGRARGEEALFKKTYLMPHAVDDRGNVLDAFGNPFSYDRENGTVRSGTAGYEDW